MKELQNPNNGSETTSTYYHTTSFEDFDSACSTPYVSAPSSPGRPQAPLAGGFFYSAPASPVHFMLSKSSNLNSIPTESSSPSPSISSSFEFDFSARYTGPASAGSMSSADELFSNGQIRPMKLSSHLKMPQVLAPLIDVDEIDGDSDELEERGRNLKMRRNRSLRRRTRSMSPLRTAYDKEEETINRTNQNVEEIKQDEVSASSSSASRSSNRWVFLKEFLYRSKSEGRKPSTSKKLWSSMSFSPVKDKKTAIAPTKPSESVESPVDKGMSKKARRRLGLSAHELHYTANRAQAEEMRKKTFLPYRRGLLSCLGFSSKSYGAMNGFAARALNPVSSR